jgi:3-hydroxyacyl-[acyl-carrier-protein] dehydratase
MRFTLIDRILELEPGRQVTAVKSPTLTEDYLKDHFPLFPVMPGVLMLEAMYQASAWLVRKTDDFSHSMVLLKEARNVKYAGFVRPGEMLRIVAEIQKREDRLTWLKASGTLNFGTPQAQVAVSARLVLESYNLADADPTREATDRYIRRTLQSEYEVLCLTMEVPVP